MKAAIALAEAGKELGRLQRQIEQSELYVSAMLLHMSVSFDYNVTPEFKQDLQNGKISIQRVLRLDNMNEVALSIRDGNDWRPLTEAECDAYKKPIQ